MALLTADCPRCGAKNMTFDISAFAIVEKSLGTADLLEAFSICRRCKQSTLFRLAPTTGLDASHWAKLAGSQNAIDHIVINHGFISLKDNANRTIPEHLPADLEEIFREAVTCLATECWNAAGCMFRLVVDKATEPLLPENGAAGGPNSFQREKLRPRLLWLLDNHRLPRDLSELAESITKDGNDGAHVGNLTSDEAEDLYDFSFALLNRLYTEPKRIELAKSRRDERRGKSGGDGSATPVA